MRTDIEEACRHARALGRPVAIADKKPKIVLARTTALGTTAAIHTEDVRPQPVFL